VTPGHLSTNPRLVKEADALTAAGYAVSVVCSRFIAWADEADREFSHRPWAVRRVPFGPIAGRRRHFIQSLGRRVCVLAFRLFGKCAERALHPVVPDLTRAACATPADLYIAHNLAALPAAYRAAQKHGARLGFDAEDFHSGELICTPEHAMTIRLTSDIEHRYLPQCEYITAASPGIARAYADTYAVVLPTVVLNVFPKNDAPVAPTERGTAQPSPSLYWFSQTIGPNRGLETVIEAIARSKSRPTLFLRGNATTGYAEALISLAERLEISDRLRFLPPAPPSEMIRLAAEHDIGLATETDEILNRDICLTNKIFTYLLAGVPVLATCTSAQFEFATAAPGAVFVYAQQDSQALASKIDDVLTKEQALARARNAAWQQGEHRFNWDMEQRKFLEVIEIAFKNPASINEASQN
jgi:glycosyltransferase involved in cell wall biosynthesis